MALIPRAASLERPADLGSKQETKKATLILLIIQRKRVVRMWKNNLCHCTCKRKSHGSSLKILCELSFVFW